MQEKDPQKGHSLVNQRAASHVSQHIGALLRIAHASSGINEAEKKRIYEIAEQELNVPRREVEVRVEYIERLENDNVEFHQIAFPRPLEWSTRLSYLLHAVYVMLCDDHMDPREVTQLHKYAQGLGYREAIIGNLSRQLSDNEAEWRATHGATPEEAEINREWQVERTVNDAHLAVNAAIEEYVANARAADARLRYDTPVSDPQHVFYPLEGHVGVGSKRVTYHVDIDLDLEKNQLTFELVLPSLSIAPNHYAAVRTLLDLVDFYSTQGGAFLLPHGGDQVRLRRRLELQGFAPIDGIIEMYVEKALREFDYWYDAIQNCAHAKAIEVNAEYHASRARHWRDTLGESEIVVTPCTLLSDGMLRGYLV